MHGVVQVEEGLDYVEAKIQASGPFDAIMGFSQGQCALASLHASRASPPARLETHVLSTAFVACCATRRSDRRMLPLTGSIVATMLTARAMARHTAVRRLVCAWSTAPARCATSLTTAAAECAVCARCRATGRDQRGGTSCSFPGCRPATVDTYEPLRKKRYATSTVPLTSSHTNLA
eukprot:6203800-Pleurochrysis_carterae.AAC.1